MKNVLTLLIALFFIGCASDPQDVPKKEISFHVAGMYCEGCVTAITDRVSKLDGAEDVMVTLDDSLVVVKFPEDKMPSDETLSALIEELGYQIVLEEEAL
jgi:copper chaperone CopZ